MKNFIYFIAFAIIALTCNVQTIQAAFPVSEKIAVENAVTAPAFAPAKYEARSTKAPERMQRDGRGARAAGAGFGVAALACGAVGLVILGIPLGICAIIFGIIGITRRKKGYAIAGIILGIIDIIGVLIFLSHMR